jgi:hypothetical protein
MTIPLPVCRASKPCVWPVGILPIGILLVSTASGLATEPHPTPLDPGPPSLVVAAQSRISREDASQSVVVTRAEGLPPRPTRPPASLALSGRAWPFALAAAADATTTYWALGRGAYERNPLLVPGRLDVVAVKIIQFPLLTKAIDAVEARHPRLGRHLRWVSLVFHAALAIHNVRMGRSAVQLGLDVRPAPLP